MNKTLTSISNMFTNIDITDMETCYTLLRREIIQGRDLKEDRCGFEPAVTKIAQTPSRIYAYILSYTPRTAEEGKKINSKDVARSLYRILHYGAPSAPLPTQFIVHFVSDAISGVTNVITFAIFFHNGLTTELATPAAFLIAAASNYALCIFLVFRHKARRDTLGEIIADLSSVGVMALVDCGLTIAFVLARVPPTLGKILSTFVGFLGNFSLRRLLVFPRPGAVRT